MEPLKILIMSDLHGYLPKIEEPFDILLNCGDTCPAHDHYFNFQKEWMENEFVDWCKTLPFKDAFSSVVMTWGNHDFVGERFHKSDNDHLKQLCGSEGNLIILKNDFAEVEYIASDGIGYITIAGTPYCKVFGNWAFMIDNEKLEKKYNKLPDKPDILITHDSPTINGLGMINEGYYGGIDAGNAVLSKWIDEHEPKMVFSGHIHSGNHNFEKCGNVWLANVSTCNERYAPVNGILKVEIDRDTKDVVGSEVIKINSFIVEP